MKFHAEQNEINIFRNFCYLKIFNIKMNENNFSKPLLTKICILQITFRKTTSKISQTFFFNFYRCVCVDNCRKQKENVWVTGPWFVC